MLLTPHEQERLLIHVAAGLARERPAAEAPSIPFILVTGWTTDPSLSEPPAGVPPAQAVLHKPVDRSLLLFTVARALTP